MKVFLSASALFFICALCHGSSGALAAVLSVPGATYETDGEVSATDSAGGGGNERYQTFVSVDAHALSAASDGSTTNLALTNIGFPAPVVILSAQSVVGLPAAFSSGFSTSAGSGGDANLQYHFEILGPTATVPVLVQALGVLVTSAVDPNIAALLNLGIGGPGVTIFDQTWTNDDLQGSATLLCGSAGCNGSVREHSVYNFQTNQIYNVAITASASVSGSVQVMSDGTIVSDNAGLQYADLSIDPYFSVAAGTPNASDYSFTFSAGIGNAPIASVPELPVWALLGVGFMMIGGVSMRQRQRLSVLPTAAFRIVDFVTQRSNRPLTSVRVAGTS